MRRMGGGAATPAITQINPHHGATNARAPPSTLHTFGQFSTLPKITVLCAAKSSSCIETTTYSKGLKLGTWVHCEMH